MTNNDSQFLDLDAFLPKEREIKIAGTVYKVNGAASVKVALTLFKNAEKWQNAPNSPEALGVLLQSVKSFFITPIEMEVLENLDMITALPKLISFLYQSGTSPIKENSEEKKTAE